MEIISKSYLSLLFGQDPKEVCRLFLKYLRKYPVFSSVIFAIPNTFHNNNYDEFSKALLNK